MQHNIDREIIRELASDDINSIKVDLQLFTYPPYRNDPFIGKDMYGKLYHCATYFYLSNLKGVANSKILF